MQEDKIIRNQLLRSLYSGIVKGEDIGKIIEELELLGITGDEIQNSLSLFFKKEEILKSDNVMLSDELIISLVDNLTDDAIVYFLQFLDYEILNDGEVQHFLNIIDKGDMGKVEDKLNIKAVSMLVNGIMASRSKIE